MKKYYAILGLKEGASQSAIRKAYRKLALLYHPDRNKNAKATERFKEMAIAYAILTGKQKPPVERHEEMTKVTRAYTSRRSYWEVEVVRIWQQMKNEKHNSMYR
jgi:preprotein translocase subunit Sec63